MVSESEALFLSAFVVSWVPIVPEPFYHEERVSIWEWLRREIFELIYGEKAKMILGLEPR